MILPLIHRILVRIEKLEDVDPIYAAAVKAGLVLADHEDTKLKQAAVDKGTVVAVGPTAFRDFGVECPIKIGDIVAFAKYAGKVIQDPEDPTTRYVLLNDEDICCLIQNASL